MKLWFSLAEAAAEQLPGLPTTKRGMARLAERENWSAHWALWRGRPGADGGGGFEHHIDQWPAPARLAYLRRHLTVDDAAPAAAAPASDDPASARAAEGRDARLTLVAAAARLQRGSGLSVMAADRFFADLYNAGSIDVPAWVRGAVGRLSPRSLARWRSASVAAPSRLAVDRAANRRGTGVLDRAEGGRLRALTLAALCKNPLLTAKHVRALALDRFGATVAIDERRVAMPPLRTWQHALAGWRHQYRHELTLMTDPDRFRSSVRYVASGSTRAVRLNEVWQIDASKADVMTLEGRQNVYVAIDIFSRRLMVLVSATAKADAVGLLIRKCLLAWGVPERIHSDNGSDFVAHQTKRLLGALGIEQELSAPFSPEQKGVVERAIGTFQRDCARTLPGFIGHSVADRKKIEAKLAFSRRLGANEETLFGVELTASELQAHADQWAAEIYAHAPHGGLRGRTPFEAAAAYDGPIRRIEDPAMLDVLLARVPGKDGIRRVTRQGIRIDGSFYYIGSVMPGEDVLCRHDPADLGRLWVFSADGETFLGEAVAPELAGLDPAEVIARVRAEEKARMDGRLADIRREGRRMKPRDVADAIRRQAQGESAALIAFPRPSEPHSTPKIAAAGDAVTAPEAVPLTGRAAEIHAALKAEGGEPRNVTPLRREETPQQRYRRATEIGRKVEAGEPVEIEAALEAGAYLAGPEYRAIRSAEETRQQRFARALRLEQALAGGGGVEAAEALWLRGYQAGSEYRAMRTIYEDFGERALR